MEEPSVRTEHASDLVEERAHVGIRVRGLEIRDDVERPRRRTEGARRRRLRSARRSHGARCGRTRLPPVRGRPRPSSHRTLRRATMQFHRDHSRRRAHPARRARSRPRAPAPGGRSSDSERPSGTSSHRFVIAPGAHVSVVQEERRFAHAGRREPARDAVVELAIARPWRHPPDLRSDRVATSNRSAPIDPSSSGPTSATPMTPPVSVGSFDHGRELPNGRRIEDLEDRHLDLESIADLRRHLHRQERVAAEVEEAVVDADLLEPELRSPDVARAPIRCRTPARRTGVARLGRGCRRPSPRAARGLGPAHPGLDPAVEIADRDKNARSDVGPQQAQECILSLRGLDRGGHAGHLRFGRVVPRIPADAEPPGAASRRDAVEHRIRAGVRREAEPAEHRRDRRVRRPSATGSRPSIASISELQPMQLRRDLVVDDRAPGLDDRAERRRARRSPRRGRRRRSSRTVRTPASTAARTSAGVAQVGREHEDVVALGTHRREPSEHLPLVLVAGRRIGPLEPLLRVGKRGAADEDEAGAERRVRATRRARCPCGRVRR